MAAEQESQLLRPGRYVPIGRMVYAMVWVGGALLFLNDIIARGPIEAGKTWGIMGILTERIAMTAGGAVAGAVGLVLCHAQRPGRGRRAARGDREGRCPGRDDPRRLPRHRRPPARALHRRCTTGNRHIFEPELFRKIRAQMEVAVAHAWTIEDDEAIRRRKRREAVAAEHRHDLEKDRAREAEVDGDDERLAHPADGLLHQREPATRPSTSPTTSSGRPSACTSWASWTSRPPTSTSLGSAIYQYQYSILHQAKPDSRVDPRGRTEAALRAGKRVSMAL